MSEDEHWVTNVRKIGAIQPVSTELLWMHGAITDDEARALGYEPPPPPTRWERLRWSWESWRHNHRPHIHLGPCDHEDRL